MSSGEFKFASEYLRLLHRDGARPFLMGNVRYCAYSLCCESDRPKCPFNHRSSQEKIPLLYNGKIHYFVQCFDGRTSQLPETDYIVIDTVQNQKTG
jgi:hypothetical protein